MFKYYSEPMELKDTYTLMISDDYSDRLKAEYYQLKIRTDRLSRMLQKYEEGKLGFMPNSPIELLKQQLKVMIDYLEILRDRILIEIQ